MKVKLVKKENLMKAANRANLVKVAVQVNGRTGQYSSHRWKNPGAALNVLKETMKRAGVKTTDELEFKDRKSKKTLNEDELIKQYKESKTTDTLQDFVKKNYTVSKAKDKPKEEKVKEKKPKDKAKNVIVAEEKPKQEKQSEPDLEQAIETLKGRTDRKDITIERENGRVYVSSPKDKAFINDVKRIGGKWDPDRKQWHVHQDRENELRDLIAEDYGWDERENEYVVVKYETNTLWANQNVNRLGKVGIASRSDYNEPVELSDNTVVLKGEFEDSSPSNRTYPMVDADIFMEFATILPKKVYDSFDAPLLRSMKVVWEGEIGEKKDIEEQPKAEGPWFENIKLQGSEKQKKWAADIRGEFSENAKNLLDKIERSSNSNANVDKIKESVKNYVDEKLKDDSSRNWIDERNSIGERDILEKVLKISSYQDKDYAEKLRVENLAPIEGASDELLNSRERYMNRGASEVLRMLDDARKGKITLDDQKAGFIDDFMSNYNETDPAYWEAVDTYVKNLTVDNFVNEDQIDWSLFVVKKTLTPKIIEDVEASDEEKALVAKKRFEMAAKILRADVIMDGDKNDLRTHARRQNLPEDTYEKEFKGLDSISLYRAHEIMQRNVSQSFWNRIVEQGIDTVQGLVKEAAQIDDDDSMWISSEDLFSEELKYVKRFGTKKIEAKNEYAKVNNYEDFNSNLSKLKDSHTDTLARAAMDMLGLDVPLYVKRNGKSLKLGFGREVDGYCEWSKDGLGRYRVSEIAVVDHPEYRQQSYKTTVHECMHGVFVNMQKSDGTSLAEMTKVFNEGMVEIMGQSAVRKAYGSDYADSLPAYLPFVTQTAVRLKEMPEFENKNIHEIGELLAQKMVAKDVVFMSSVVDHLEASRKKVRRLENLDVDKYIKNTDAMERAAKKDAEKLGQDYEKSDMANLVEQIKSGLISLQGAINSSQYKEVAIALLYRLLEEDDEEAAETLSAFQ